MQPNLQLRLIMWSWFNCYLSGRHEFGVWCEPGAIFLRCMHCGKRSSGWSIDQKQTAAPLAIPATTAVKATMAEVTVSAPASRVLPFGRVAS